MGADLGRILDALPAMVWTALPDGRLEFVNHRWSDYTGQRLDESDSWAWQAAVHSDDLPLGITSRAASHGEIEIPNNIALTVQQPFTQDPGGSVEPEHIGVPLAVEVSHSDDCHWG